MLLNRSLVAPASRLTSLSLFVMAAFFSHPPVLPDETVVFGCFSQPLGLAEAQSYPFPGPIHVVLCPDQPPPCNQPPAPTVLPILICDGPCPYAATELLLSVDVIDGGSLFGYVVWEAEVRETDVFSDLWSHYSHDSVINRTENTYLFRATGLRHGLEHRFRVGFCRNTISTTGCSCWSDWSYQVVDFPWPALQLDPPDGLIRQVEDEFEMPVTRPKKTVTGARPTGCPGPDDRCPGDGLGVDSAWMDKYPVALGNGAHIAEDNGESFLLLPINAIARYSGSLSTNFHAWAEIQFRTLDPDGEYRIDVSAREFIDLYGPEGEEVSTGHAYFAQLRKEGTETPEPTIFIYRILGLADPIGDELVENLSGVGCSDVSDLLTDGNSALLRIEVDDDADASRPTITATVAWDCDGSTCNKRCSLEVIDLDDKGKALYRKNGGWKIQSHHMSHRVDVFRAGSESP